MNKERSVYISIGNENTPNKVVIGGEEIDITGVTYFALELKPLERPHYVLSRGVKVATDIPFSQDEANSEIKKVDTND